MAQSGLAKVRVWLSAGHHRSSQSDTIRPRARAKETRANRPSQSDTVKSPRFSHIASLRFFFFLSFFLSRGLPRAQSSSSFDARRDEDSRRRLLSLSLSLSLVPWLSLSAQDRVADDSDVDLHTGFRKRSVSRRGAEILNPSSKTNRWSGCFERDSRVVIPKPPIRNVSKDGWVVLRSPHSWRAILRSLYDSTCA